MRQAMADKPYKLTKSRLISYRQCKKRLWLETHRPGLAQKDASAQHILDMGNEVGRVARKLYGDGPVLDIRNGVPKLLEQTAQLLESGAPRAYETGFLHDEVLVLADVLLRDPSGVRAVEVKSSTGVKAAHIEDCAIQKWVMTGAGIEPESVSVAHIDSGFVYPGQQNYQGLLREVPVDRDIASFQEAVPRWVADAKSVIAGAEPDIAVGDHCYEPYQCPFLGYCSPLETGYPVTDLPRAARLVSELAAEGCTDIRDIPDGRLTKPLHLRIWQSTRTGQHYFDPRAREIISSHPGPQFFLDFETISFAVPRWVGTRPYQALPFQWSLHIRRGGALEHREFLDESGESPMRACTETLLDALDDSGVIYTYSGYERRILNEMAVRFTDLKSRIVSVSHRLFDLCELLRAHYYHPAMRGSWSIKKVLPTIAPGLSYAGMSVPDGTAAQLAYLKLVAPGTAAGECQALAHNLKEYCGQDSLAMVRIVEFVEAKGAARPERGETGG